MTDLERAEDFLGMWFSPDDRIAPPTPEEVVPALAIEFEKVRADERQRVLAELRRSIRAPRQPGRLDFEEQLSWS